MIVYVTNNKEPNLFQNSLVTWFYLLLYVMKKIRSLIISESLHSRHGEQIQFEDHFNSRSRLKSFPSSGLSLPDLQNDVLTG